MMKEALQAIEGVEAFPIIGLIVLLAGFLVAVVRVLRMKKSEVDYASRLPLDDNDGVK